MISGLSRISERVAREAGTLVGQGRRAVGLIYPSTYAVGMSSLGFQQVYRLLNALPDTVAERAFLPEADEEQGPLLTYETKRPVADFPVLAFSLAYELDLMGLFSAFDLTGVRPLARERRERDPWIVIGGPLTTVNATPLAPFADVIVMGEAEELLGPLVDILFSGGGRQETLKAVADLPGCFVPSMHGHALPEPCRCPLSHLPARSAIVTPYATLSDMFLVEAERGCSRGCAFCVMRREASGGMRLVPTPSIIAAIPASARRVGLVGAAVSDHPEITAIVRAVVESGREVSLSSLRADRTTPELVSLLKQGGLRTLTVAADGASERLRDMLGKYVTRSHLCSAARLCGELGIGQLKTYVMVGVPGETPSDLDELAACLLEQAALAGRHTRVTAGVATFVPKPKTPLCGAAFVGVKEAASRLEHLRSALKSKVELRAVSSRWAWVEYLLATGSAEDGERALSVHRAGNRFANWKRTFAARKSDSALDMEGAP